MNIIFAAFAIWIAGAFLCLFLGKRNAFAGIIGPASVVLGSAAALLPVGTVFFSGTTLLFRHPWQMPFGSISLGLDPISAVFSVPILLVCPLAAVYGGEYLRHYEKEKGAGRTWFMFNLLTAAMFLVVLSRNGMLFLLAWEIMSLSSFFLVMFESNMESVRRAGWIYLVATHIGTAFILVLFAVLSDGSGSLDFDGFKVLPGVAGAAFVLALVGFGTKAGFMPMHVWLPEAHPAAPSHVSAVMSGVMIKTGIYGMVRTLTFLGPAPSWWGWTLVGIGCFSGVLGVLFALAQHDLKRLLAYHSVENIGIIALGLGLGLLGITYGKPVMILAGFAGGLFHVINHALFKSLLFLGAGAVLRAAETREMDRLGGLLKKMPRTGAAFLIGAVAISGLPPLNGFMSEFLIYLSAFNGVPATGWSFAAGSLFALGSLALIGGLAAACFTKVFGIVFLGEPRSSHASNAAEAGPAMTWPSLILALACFLAALVIPFALPALAAAVRQIPGADGFSAALPDVRSAAKFALAGAWGAAAFSAALVLLRKIIFRRKRAAATCTWDCGYVAPNPRMQYTSSSFAEPITVFFEKILRTRRKFVPPNGLFPANASLSTDTPDISREKMYAPAFAGVEKLLAQFRWLQHGRLNLYILYIVLTLLALLAWKLR